MWYGRPLNTLYDPMNNEEGTAGDDGVGRINGKWAVIIASDNKVLAGAWIAVRRRTLCGPRICPSG